MSLTAKDKVRDAPAGFARKRTVADVESGADRVLDVRDAHVRFATSAGAVHAVDNVSISIDAGKVLGVVGESGSGKSVLAKTIMRLLPKHNVTTQGHVRLRGADLTELSPKRMRAYWGPEIAMVFQDALTALNPVMRVGDQIVEQLREHMQISKAAARAKAVELLTEVGIADAGTRRRQYPHQLSGGMRQRVMIALALSCDPALLLADEPTTALDVTIQAQIMELLRREQTTRRMAMLLITHDLGLAAKYTDEMVVMYGGQIVERAPTSVLLSQTRSPYTDALRRATPRLTDPPHTRLQTLPGRPPVVMDRFPGCRFAPRCASAQERCMTERPDLVPADGGAPGHLYRCFYPVGTPAGAEALARNQARGHTAVVTMA